MSTLSVEDLKQFNEELAAAVKANVPLPELLAYDTARLNQRQSSAYSQLQDQLSQGHSLAESIRISGVASETYANLIEAAEKTGHLPETLNELTLLTTQCKDVSQRILRSLVYPSFVIALTWVALCTVFLDLSVLIEEDYANAVLQETERLELLTTLQHTRLYWGIGVPVVVAALWFMAQMFFQGKLSALSGRLGAGLFLPLAKARHALRESLFSRLLGLMCQHKVPLSESLPIVTSLYGTKTQQETTNSALSYLEGQEAASADLKYWPGYLHVLRSANEDHPADQQLMRVAEYYKAMLEHQLFVLETLAPRIIFVVCALIILIPFVLLVWWPMSEHLMQLGTKLLEGTP